MKKLIMSIIASICALAGCQAQGFRSVEADEFEKLIADTAVVRLDVRTAEEYAAGHIEGAACIDVNKPDFLEQAKMKLPKDKTIALYCRSGRRSKKAASILAGVGYTVVELNSGWLGWTAAGKPAAK